MTGPTVFKEASRLVPSRSNRMEVGVARSGSLAVVVPQKPPESFTTCDLTLDLPHLLARVDQAIAQRLVITFRVIMAQEVRDSRPQHPFSKEDQPGKTLLLDREHEALNVRIGIHHAMRRILTLRQELFGSLIPSTRSTGESSGL